MSTKKNCSRVLKLTLVFQLAFGSFFVNLAVAKGGENRSNNSIFKYAVRQGLEDPFVRKHSAKYLEFADDLDSGKLAEANPKKYDSYRLTGQKIIIYTDKGPYEVDMDKATGNLPIVPFSSLKVVYQDSTSELIFEAYIGANQSGEGGKLVAKQIIPKMNIAAFAEDKELLSIIDNNGSLHVIDMGFVKEQAFKSTIPVLTNFWKPREPVDLKGKNVKANYLTRGLQPFNQDQTVLNSVLPRDSDGVIRMRAGDLVVTVDDHAGNNELYGVFSREVTYEHIIFATTVLEWIAFVSNPDIKSNDNLKRIIAQLEEMSVQNEAHEIQVANTNYSVRQALLGVKPEQIEFLSKRTSDIKGGEEIRGLKTRNYDTFSVEQWLEDFQAIQESAKNEKDMISSKISATSGKNILTLHDLELRLKSLESQEKNGSYSTEWRGLLSSKNANSTSVVEPDGVGNSLDENTETSKKRVFGYLTRLRELALHPASVILAGFSAYIAYPFAYEASELMQQVNALSWIYENAISDVAKDEAYRVVNNKHMLAVTALWPLGVLTSALAGKFIKIMEAVHKNSTSKIAQKFRDLRKNWVDLTPWQRITSFGMRFYGTIIYPLWNTAVEKGLRQKSFLPALRSGINPFSIIKKDSVVGQRVGLEKDTSAGLNNPLSGLTEKSAELFEKERNLKGKLQSAIRQQKSEVKSLSWLLSALVVSEKEGVDPALLTALGADIISPEDIQNIFSDEKKSLEFSMLLEGMSKHLDKMQYNTSEIDVASLSEEQMKEMLTLAYEKAAVIKSKSMLTKRFGAVTGWLKYKTDRFKNWVFNWGLYEHEFLKKVFTNKFVSNQVERHFVPDHLMVAGMYAQVGDRANLSKPDDLAADPNGFLWTNGDHWSDISLNTYAHFFVAGSQLALVFQRLHSQTEDNYKPIEDTTYATQKRGESFARTTGQWFWNVANPLKSDLGGVMWKRFVRTLGTMQAGVIMFLTTRLIFSEQAATDVLLAFLIYRFAAQWVFGYPWDIIDRGTHLESERIEKMDELLKDARFKISQGVKEENPDKAKQLLDEGVDEMIGLFQKYNPRAIQQAEKGVLALSNIQSLVENAKNVKVSEEAKLYYTTVVSLSLAISKSNKKDTEYYSEALRTILAKGSDVNIDELRLLNAQNLLDFSVKNTPIYTDAHTWTAWLASWLGGAVLTTWLSIPLAVATFNPEWVTIETLISWFLASMGLYGGAYLTYGKKPWEFYLEKVIPNIKDKLGLKSRSACSKSLDGD